MSTSDNSPSWTTTADEVESNKTQKCAECGAFVNNAKPVTVDTALFGAAVIETELVCTGCRRTRIDE